MQGSVGLASRPLRLAGPPARSLNGCFCQPVSCRGSAGAAAVTGQRERSSSSSKNSSSIRSSNSSSGGSGRRRKTVQQEVALKFNTQEAAAEERNQQLVYELYTAYGHLGFSRDFFVKITTRRGVRVTPQQFGERFSMLQRVTGAHDPKQQAALARILGTAPMVLGMLPETVQSKARVLQQQLQQQLGVDPKRTQQLISKHPRVLEFLADSLAQKATEQGQLLELEAADVVTQLWMRRKDMFSASTPKLHERLAQLQLLLQPHMSPADVRQLVLSQPSLVATHTSVGLHARLAAVKECLPGWSPQQLGVALLKHSSVLTFSPDTIRYKWRILSRYRDTYMLGTKEQEEQRQQQQQPHQASELGLLTRAKERYAMLEYIMEQQVVPNFYEADASKDGSSSGDHISGVSPESIVHAKRPAQYMPPASIVLNTRPHLFKRLVLEHYPGFPQWYKQRQQQEKQKKQ